MTFNKEQLKCKLIEDLEKEGILPIEAFTYGQCIVEALSNKEEVKNGSLVKYLVIDEIEKRMKVYKPEIRNFIEYLFKGAYYDI